MPEKCDFVRCLMVDFSRAFNRVDHPTLLPKLDRLNLSPNAMNWIISFLTNRTQVVKATDQLSLPQPINTTIVQGSGVGSMLYVIMESDLRTLLYHLVINCTNMQNLLVPRVLPQSLNMSKSGK